MGSNSTKEAECFPATAVAHHLSLSAKFSLKMYKLMRTLLNLHICILGFRYTALVESIGMLQNLKSIRTVDSTLCYTAKVRRIMFFNNETY